MIFKKSIRSKGVLQLIEFPSQRIMKVVTIKAKGLFVISIMTTPIDAQEGSKKKISITEWRMTKADDKLKRKFFL